MAEAHLVHARQGALITYLLILKCNQSLECNAIMRRHYLQNVIWYTTRNGTGSIMINMNMRIIHTWKDNATYKKGFNKTETSNFCLHLQKLFCMSFQRSIRILPLPWMNGGMPYFMQPNDSLSSYTPRILSILY